MPSDLAQTVNYNLFVKINIFSIELIYIKILKLKFVRGSTIASASKFLQQEIANYNNSINRFISSN